MDLKVCGILDIALVLLLLIFLVLGYKKGFINKAVSLIGFIVVIVFSVMYCGQFASFLEEHKIIYPSIYNKVYGNAATGMADKLGANEPTVENVLTIALGIPSIFANLLIKWMSIEASTDVVAIVAAGVSHTAMVGVSFVILVVGIFLLCGIVKLIASVLRNNALFRFVDGLFGALLYITIYMFVVFAIFGVVNIFWEHDWFASAKSWLEVDMGMNSEYQHTISIAKYVFESNILVKLVELFL